MEMKVEYKSRSKQNSFPPALIEITLKTYKSYSNIQIMTLGSSGEEKRLNSLLCFCKGRLPDRDLVDED